MAWERLAPTASVGERPWVQEAVFGSLRLRNRLDHLLDRHLHRGLSSVAAPLLRVLRLGAYQVLYMDSVPAYAAVSQSVAQAAALGGGKAAGLVNGVLRALDAEGVSSSDFPAFEGDPAGHLEQWESHPRWLAERWIERFGADAARAMAKAGNRRPGLYLRPIGISREEALARLEQAGLDATPGPGAVPTVRLSGGADLSEALTLVPGVVQDPAAALVSGFVDVRAGETLADLCAAPGGKGVVLGDSGAWVVGLDASLARLRRMEGTLRRLGMPSRLVVARGQSPPIREMDAVLVDAPCTGTGTLARNPDARWRLGPDSPALLAEAQRSLLDGAATIVRPGGLLVYSTCTIEVEENEDVVGSFLQARSDFRLDDEGPAFLRVFPGDVSTDGSFAARLRRSR